MVIWAALTRAIAVAGVIHSDRWISIWSTTTAFPSSGTSMRKNQVAKRFGAPSGGTHEGEGHQARGVEVERCLFSRFAHGRRSSCGHFNLGVVADHRARVIGVNPTAGKDPHVPELPP